MTDKVLVLTTAGNENEAQKIARGLVEGKLAACVNIVPRIQSVYRWEGKLETSEEYLLLIKTTSDRIAEVQAAVRELHSYELPEFVVISIEGGSEEYLNWIEESVR
jgi:periplasmic divalent cation tolerance protein